MRNGWLIAVVLLLATSAAAGGVYVPLGGGGSRTEVRIANPSPARAIVTVQLLGHVKTREIPLDAGQTVSWNDVVAELFGGRTLVDAGALRIGGDPALEVTAVSHCGSCGSIASLPLLEARQAIDQGDVPMRASLPWRSGMVAVNPSDDVALVTVTVLRGETMVEQSLLRVPARGVRRVRLERELNRGHNHGSSDRLTFRSSRPLMVFGHDNNERSGAQLFTRIAPDAHGGKRRSVRSASPPPAAQSIVLNPWKDNTLFESTTGAVSNGAGVHLFAGATGSRSLRRALLAFDVAALIPPGSRITRATLELQVSLTIAGPQRMALHRVTADWGEGSSNAGSFRDGTGATARTGDATWLHRFSPSQPWTAQGGDFNAAADASATIDETTAVWPSSEAMIARVQGWLDQPATNFGWIVIGNESESVTAYRFDSREFQPAATRPMLRIEFVR